MTWSDCCDHSVHDTALGGDKQKMTLSAQALSLASPISQAKNWKATLAEQKRRLLADPSYSGFSNIRHNRVIALPIGTARHLARFCTKVSHVDLPYRVVP